jgi:hypothetical protein
MGGKANRSNSKAIFFVIILFFQSLRISAQVGIPDSVVIERIQIIEKMLVQGNPGAGFWWYGWLYGYSAATIGQAAVSFSSNNKGVKQDMALGAATTLLGAAGQLVHAYDPL